MLEGRLRELASEVEELRCEKGLLEAGQVDDSVKIAPDSASSPCRRRAVLTSVQGGGAASGGGQQHQTTERKGPVAEEGTAYVNACGPCAPSYNPGIASPLPFIAAGLTSDPPAPLLALPVLFPLRPAVGGIHAVTVRDAQIAVLQHRLSEMDKVMVRLKEVTKERISAFREACYSLFGYR